MLKEFVPTRYQLMSVKTGKLFEDTGWLLDAPGEVEPTLIRAVYDSKQLQLGSEKDGLYQFSSWLPVRRKLEGSSAPVTYRSEKLGGLLGLENLYITFSGYWPERGAFMNTCSFKETEAYSVCGRLNPDHHKILVVASAGNTARAFARVCSENHIPLLLCVPEDNIDALWFDKKLNDCVRLISTPSGSDYFDAIQLSNTASSIEGFLAEGGAKNVARRDGMSTTVLSATSFIHEIPDYYFQAVGSGTGAIAAWEANLRLLQDGRFGNRKMKLMVSQNIPFVPMFEAWEAGSRNLLMKDDETARHQTHQIMAKVLSNRRPPYGIYGGLFDALSDTQGKVLLADNTETLEAMRLFEQYEGVDIHPAAGVAVASLMKEIKENRLDKKSIIMLNITGGGENLFMKNHDLYYLKPSLIVESTIEKTKLEDQLKSLW